MPRTCEGRHGHLSGGQPELNFKAAHSSVVRSEPSTPASASFLAIAVRASLPKAGKLTLKDYELTPEQPPDEARVGEQAVGAAASPLGCRRQRCRAAAVAGVASHVLLGGDADAAGV